VRNDFSSRFGLKLVHLVLIDIPSEDGAFCVGSVSKIFGPSLYATETWEVGADPELLSSKVSKNYLVPFCIVSSPFCEARIMFVRVFLAPVSRTNACSRYMRHSGIELPPPSICFHIDMGSQRTLSLRSRG